MHDQTAEPSHSKNKRKLWGYLALCGLFFILSYLTLHFLHNYFGTGKFKIPSTILTPVNLLLLGILLILYFLSDGLRLYCVIRAVGTKIPFLYILKLVFVNIFISNVTPMATGGGFVQVYFMARKGMSIGQATAATSLRTILSALVLITLAPIIMWVDHGQFGMFSTHRLLYIVTIAAIGYLAIFWIVLFKIQVVKRWIVWLLLLLRKLKILSSDKYRRIYIKLFSELRLFVKGFRLYFQKNAGWAVLSMASTLLFLMMLFSFSIILMRAMGYRVSVWTILAFQVVVTFFMYFTPTPGATGVAEGGYGLLFAQLVQKQDIAPLVLSWRFTTVYIGVIIGMLVTCIEFLRKDSRLFDGT